jgi:tetratricopeptide (TPR) repeat protein
MKQKTSSGASKDQQTDTDSRASKDTDVLSKFVEPLLFEHIATTTPGLTVTMVDRMLEFEYEQRKTSQEERNPKNKSLQHDLLQPQIIEYLQDEDKKENKPVQPNQNAKKQMNLIEKFIEKNPRIVPKESVPEVPHDLSEESVKENEFISETLADIYIKQKKYDKALQIYQKLSLKYPQKSIYFADQISKVEDFIKNDK